MDRRAYLHKRQHRWFVTLQPVQPVAGGRLAVIVVVFSRLIFQRLHAGGELAERLCKQRDDGFLTLPVGYVNLGTGRHHESGHGSIVAELGDFGKPSKVKEGRAVTLQILVIIVHR